MAVVTVAGRTPVYELTAADLVVRPRDKISDATTQNFALPGMWDGQHCCVTVLRLYCGILPVAVLPVVHQHCSAVQNPHKSLHITHIAGAQPGGAVLHQPEAAVPERGHRSFPGATLQQSALFT